MKATCKYCGDPLETVLTNGGVAIPDNSPLYQSLVCDECFERGQDWFHDIEMEDR